MISLIILTVIIIYIYISISLVKFVCRRTRCRTKRYTAITLIAILPFLDMILHYPVYWVLSSTVPEIERYQPYKKVEGFFVDFIPNDNVAFVMFLHETLKKKYSIYFEKTGDFIIKNGHREKLYFKAYWINDSNSTACIQPVPSTVKDEYIELIKNNWCIAVDQIEKHEVTRYWKLTTKKIFSLSILHFSISVVDFIVSDRHTDEKIFRLRDFYVDKSWMTVVNIVNGVRERRSGTPYTYTQDGKHFEFPDYKIIKILDSEELPNI